MAAFVWDEALAIALTERQRTGRFRQLQSRSGAQGVHLHVDGQTLLSFASNDYLGLANHPALQDAIRNTLKTHGVGSGAAHLLSGHTDMHAELERRIAAWLGQERALLFSTGYMANLGVIDGLLGREDVLLQDKLNHASLLDAGRLTAAKMWRYPHADMAALANRLERAYPSRRRLIATDGVFSMDGDIAPLPEIVALAKSHQAAVLLDDAHGMGVLGQRAAGTLAHFNLAPDAVIQMGTLGKALGTAGAFVAGSEMLIASLVQSARSFVYTTASPAILAAATLTSLDLLQSETWRHQHLQALIAHFKAGMQHLNWPLLPSDTPIQPVLLPDEQSLMQLAHTLRQAGIWVAAIRPPTASCRLRITLSAAHTVADIDRLLSVLEAARVSV